MIQRASEFEAIRAALTGTGHVLTPVDGYREEAGPAVRAGIGYAGRPVSNTWCRR